jgi:pimeloyl-ACP methyl ester carboxylesterase
MPLLPQFDWALRRVGSERFADPHQFADLGEGRCHYRIDGPTTGPLILLVHGATVPAWEFDRLVPFLSQAGFRTLRADLYGHGYSDRPRTRYDVDLFTRQLVELLDHLRIVEPVHLLGHSLGAAVAARLARRHPQRCNDLIFAAPLVDFAATLSALRWLRAPLLGEALMAGLVVPMLRRRRRLRYSSIRETDFAGKFRDQLRKPGFGRALLSMIRHGALGDQREHYRALSATAHRVLFLRGGEDEVLSQLQFAAVLEALPRASHYIIDGTPHSFLLTHPELVAPQILVFLQRP